MFCHRGLHRVASLVELADLLPTILAAAGGRIPDDVEGADLRALFSDAEASVRAQRCSRVSRALGKAPPTG